MNNTKVIASLVDYSSDEEQLDEQTYANMTESTADNNVQHMKNNHNSIRSPNKWLEMLS